MSVLLPSLPPFLFQKVKDLVGKNFTYIPLLNPLNNEVTSIFAADENEVPKR